MSAMVEHPRHHTPWYLWPFVALWKLLALIVGLTGRLVAVLLGLALWLLGWVRAGRPEWSAARPLAQP